MPILHLENRLVNHPRRSNYLKWLTEDTKHRLRLSKRQGGCQRQARLEAKRQSGVPLQSHLQRLTQGAHPSGPCMPPLIMRAARSPLLPGRRAATPVVPLSPQGAAIGRRVRARRRGDPHPRIDPTITGKFDAKTQICSHSTLNR